MIEMDQDTRTSCAGRYDERMTIATTDRNKTLVSTNRCLDTIPNLGALFRVGNGIITNKGLEGFPDRFCELRRKMVA